MNDIPDTAPCEQLVRDQCRVGDWVDAMHVPEWRDAVEEKTFRPESPIVISPQLGQYGGVAPAGHPDEWKFALERCDGKAVWRRSV